MDANPYESPRRPDESDLAVDPVAHDAAPFESAHGRAVFAIGALLFVGLAEAAWLVATISQIQLLELLRSGGEVAEARAEMNDLIQGLIALTSVVLWLVSGVAFLTWLHRAYKNLPALGATNLYTTPGGAVGWWFCPILNLYKPYKIVREVWLTSASATLTGDVRPFVIEDRAPLVGWWWTAWIVQMIVNRLASQWPSVDPTLDQLISESYVLLASNIATTIAAALAVFVVRGIDQRQEHKHEAFTRFANPSSPLV